MNILIIHSAKISLVNEIIEKVKMSNNDKVYIITYKKNKGEFKHKANEIYFKNNDYRIGAYEVINQLKEVIEENDIGYLVGMYSNTSGNGYENIKTIFSMLEVPKKIIFNDIMEEIKPEYNASDSVKEFYNCYEDKILPVVVDSLIQLRKKTKMKTHKNTRKIMFVFDVCSINGVTNLIFNFALKLVNDYDICCVFDTNGLMYEKFLKNNIKTYIRDKDNFDCVCDYKFQYYLQQILNYEKPDVIIIAGLNTLVPATLASCFECVPKIIKMNNEKLPEILDSKKCKYQMKLFQHVFDKIIVISNYVKNSLIDAGIESNKIKVVYGSNIEIKLCKEKSKSYSNIFNNDKKNIVLISRISPEKGIDLFVKAIGSMDKAIKEKCRFHIIGDGISAKEIKALISELKLNNIISMWGYQQNAFKYIKSSYLTISTTHTEGLGLTILEAMSMSKICIAPKVGGILEIIENEKNGLLYDEGDFIMLAKLITYCVNNEEKVNLLSKNAVQTIEEKFDINKIIIQLKKIIEE